MTDLATSASLIVAAMDLKAVQLIRDAIRTADISAAVAAGGVANSGFGPAAVYEPRPHINPEPLVEPRPHFHPTPQNDSLPRFGHDGIEADYDDRCKYLCPCPSAEAHESRITPSPIQPPWKVLPWQNRPGPSIKIKLVFRHPDNLCKGSIIDTFI